MKKITSIITIALFAISIFLPQYAISQSPQKMSYQSVIRNATNNLVAESTVGVKISILQGTPAGTAVYVETHTTMTNINGLVSLEIGMGTPLTGTFASVDWSAGPYYLRTDTDPLGGTTYILTGTTELLSVPYALYAANSGSWTVTADVVHTDMAVGIGTETPSGKFHVIDDVGTYPTAIFGESAFEGSVDLYGVRGMSINGPGYGFGGYFEGGWRGVYAEANSTTFGGQGIGVFALATGSAGTRTGVRAIGSNPGGIIAYGLHGNANSATTNIGVFGTASGGTTNWAGYFTGNVRVKGVGFAINGTDESSALLHVIENDAEKTSTIYGENTLEGNTDKFGVRGKSVNAPGWGYGGRFEGGFMGAYARANSSTYSGTTYGLYGEAVGSAGTQIGVYGKSSGGTTNWAGYFNGNVRIIGTLDNTSDARLKKDIEDLENALDIIKQLEPKTYEFRTDEFPQMGLDKRPQLGFIAQDMEQVLPQLVRTAIHPGFHKDEREGSDMPDIPDSPDVDVKSINYIGIIPVLTQGIKELTSEVEALASEIKAKDQANKELKVQVAQLEYKLESVDAMTIRMEQIEKELQNLRK